MSREIDRASSALLLRPDGRIERLVAPSRTLAAGGYASERPGRSDAAAIAAGARSDRRHRRRRPLDPVAGRLVDLAV